MIMRLTILTATACLALAGCSKPAEAPADANADAANEAVAAAFEIKETSWEFTDPETKKLIFESVDANGNYIANAGAEHFDHGTAVMKDGKACFTSAMDDEGEVCWTNPNVEVGQSGETTSDKGEKLTVKRVEYKPLTM
jgi:ABC-type glycerol-3-phosphate transport system substrate-binding protein